MPGNLLIILATSLLVIALFHRLRLPPVLGYLCVGLLLGPSAFGWVDYDDNLPQLAEMGVVFLLFTLGLEFSLPKMIALRQVVFGFGSLQVLACGLPLTGLLLWIGMDIGVACLIGAGLALSSTAIVGKELGSLGEVFSPHGQNAIGVLIFQDLVAVLLLTLVPALTGDRQDAWYWAVAITLGKTLLLFVGLLAVSRWLLPRLFREVAQVHSAELFVMLALVIVLLTAWITHLLGLSMALGAFLAGMLLGESHYRHQVEADIRPFRDILLGLFFVSVGMLIDLNQFAEHGALIAGIALTLLLVKGSVIALLARLRGNDLETSWRTGVALAQGGEFCFALVTQAQHGRLLDGQQASLLLSAIFCSMVLTPPLLRSAPRLAAYLQRRARGADPLEAIAAHSTTLNNHAVICGYGRVGQSIARILEQQAIPFVALDDDPVRIEEAAAGERNVHFGDSRRADLLEAVGTLRARLLVVAVNDADIALKVVQSARQLHPALPILVRTRDDSHLARLQAAGATEVVPEVMESSLMLASHALVLLGLPRSRVEAHMEAVRRNRYRLLHGYYPGGQANLVDAHGQPRRLLHAVNLNEGAYACGRTLGDLRLERLGLEVQGIRRLGAPLQSADETLLQDGDAVLICGGLQAIEAGEALLLTGSD
ncbi:monovalent cation:proton antiporter family protein [Pseudomonas sp. D(2018)]|uniref:monovalent cation:proton antiporter family protein n=1 Tax=Pseudomonas sp. D(2018) TaxID=2502238 RepID=UPI0010F9C9D2|nr:monovalent cation:proton antiporter family protein [Pseudomonas sp. D(2018)]